ncbi:hypothetical protein LMG7974_00960 [Campylobacter majalis]|uniref:Methylenetetrahydrofolate reductase n=1 Tax=Campylobacter majalis TaxID=2790656 RepID=A0ABN7K731_9BACT|nr:methylenetetrahydrofolate reductase [Campylobacter majalis]CAD7288339.1 hypothetical protein LMG7974_00960 [Campylobacter majalis]
MLQDKIKNGDAGILLYGLTPPKSNKDESDILRIAGIWRDRIQSIGVDGIVLYDIQDEADRTDDERTFEYIQTISPEIYYQKYLKTDIPAVIYKAVGKYDEIKFNEYLASLVPNSINVFVGASSKNTPIKLTLEQAYKISKKQSNRPFYGGVCIPERHAKKADEHLRVAAKTLNGCEFFISQAVYNLENAKNFIDEYAKMQTKKVPIIFTFTPCGSLKTLEFMKWLGISIPQNLQDRLINSQDILKSSVDLGLDIFNFLYKYALNKGISVGANVESISTRKVEIQASIELLNGIKHIINTASYAYKI